MERFCIFCGNKPEEKTDEHILPMWLLSLTGDPKRVVNLGLNKIGKIEQRKYSYDSFKFPACYKCNEKYGLLESEVKIIVSKLLDEEAISSVELDKLFDWFDKVRVGLWLGYFILDKNISSIVPNFYISHRISQCDRLLHISKIDCNQKGLSFVGCDLPSFSFTPSCFGLIINNFYFINISYNFLFSRRIGFSYPISIKLFPNSNYQETNLAEGTKRIIKPLIRKKFKVNGTELYQPIFSQYIKNAETKILYENEYVKKHSLDWNKGKGKIFYLSNCDYLLYPDIENYNWLLSLKYEQFDIHLKHVTDILEWQIFINKLHPKLDSLPKDEQKRIKKLLLLCNTINSKFISSFKKQHNIPI